MTLISLSAHLTILQVSLNLKASSQFQLAINIAVH